MGCVRPRRSSRPNRSIWPDRSTTGATIRAQIHAQVCEKSWNPQLNAFTQVYGSDELDASVLLMPLVGFLPPTDPRVIGTLAAIEK